jgi:hypothetical protein
VIERNYDDTMDALAEEYGSKALELLRTIRGFLAEAGLPVDAEPVDDSADDYRWRIVIDTSEQVDVSIVLHEERDYDGSDGWGINFSISIVKANGEIIGDYCPYNFTAKVWVDARDVEAVAARWDLLSSADNKYIPKLIKEAT